MQKVIEIANFLYNYEKEVTKTKLSLFKLNTLLFYSNIIYFNINSKYLFTENMYLIKDEKMNYSIYISEIEYENYSDVDSFLGEDVMEFLIELYNLLGIYTDYALKRILFNDMYLNLIDSKNKNRESIYLDVKEIIKYYEKINNNEGIILNLI
ncbi:hypothetical protein ACQRBF_00040 [Peptoniphilaceae bacterium SGI.131]